MHYYHTVEDFNEWSLFEILRHLKLSRSEEAAILVCRSVRTLKRWNHNTPPQVRRFFLALGGYLESVSSEFEGWRIHDNNLWTPSGYRYSPNEILAIPYYQQIMSAARAQENPRALNWLYPDNKRY